MLTKNHIAGPITFKYNPLCIFVYNNGWVGRNEKQHSIEGQC